MLLGPCRFARKERYTSALDPPVSWCGKMELLFTFLDARIKKQLRLSPVSLGHKAVCLQKRRTRSNTVSLFQAAPPGTDVCFHMKTGMLFCWSASGDLLEFDCLIFWLWTSASKTVCRTKEIWSWETETDFCFTMLQPEELHSWCSSIIIAPIQCIIENRTTLICIYWFGPF